MNIDSLRARFTQDYCFDRLPPEISRDTTIRDGEMSQICSSDVYALGVTAYYVLTGKLPREGDFFDIMEESRIIKKPSSCNLHINAALDCLIMGMLEFMPKDRPSTKEVSTQLETYVHNNKAK